MKISRYFFSLIFILFFAVLIIESCKKDKTVNDINSTLLDSAQNWYKSQVSLRATKPDFDIDILKPQWGKAVTIRLKNSENILGVTLFKSDSVYIELNFSSIKGKSYGIIKYYNWVNSRMLLYSGTGTLLYQGYYNFAVKKAQLSPNNQLKGNRKIMGIEDRQYLPGVTVIGGNDTGGGNYTPIPYVPTFPVSPVIPIVPQPNYGGGGGSTTAPKPAIKKSVKDIENLVENNKCLKNLINQLKDNELKTAITNVLLNTFKVNDIINVTFSEGILLGNTAAETSLTKSGNFYNVDVIFNTPYIQNSSQEYLLETILHEIYHAYLYANPNIKSQITNQHIFMVQNYVNTQITSLKTAFPSLSDYDAKCLVLSGYGQMFEKNDDASSVNTLNTLLKSHKVTLNDVSNTNLKYKNGTKGTKCSN